MSFPCAVSIDLARYERHIDALEKRDAYLSKARDTFVENRAEDLMQNPSMILQFLWNIPTRYDLVLGIAIRDAIAQSGKCWDGVHALERLLKEQARDEALHEWDRKEPLMDDDGSADFHEDERE